MVTYDKNLQAKIVKLWNTRIMIPSELGKPRVDQMQGTDAEQLCELSGRTCYDSLGTGRNSADYHTHISQVKHFSTVEHAAFSVELEVSHQHHGENILMLVLLALQNRPQLQINYQEFGNSVRVTLNLRHVVEWDLQTKRSDTCQQSPQARRLAGAIKEHLLDILTVHCPLILGLVPKSDRTVDYSFITAKVVEPETDNEKFVSVFMAGGRGFSHEQVRHRFGISQRSSRFCDEAESPFTEHPLMTEFMADDKGVDKILRDAMRDTRASMHQGVRDLYRAEVKSLQAWLESRGVDKLNARKQARGAARNDLATSLYTELIFSANLTSWKHMYAMRSTQFADAEIREVYCRLLPEFQKHGLFTDWKLTPAPDGLGYCVVLP